MGELKHRKYFTSTIPIELVDKIKQLSDDTRIPVSKLVEEALTDLLVKHQNKAKKKKASEE